MQWTGFDNGIFVITIHIINFHSNRRLPNIEVCTLALVMVHRFFPFHKCIV